MSARPHSPARHTGRRKKGRRGRNTEGVAPQVGVGKGMPRYLAKPRASEADVSSASEKEARAGHGHEVSEAPVATPLGTAAAQAMQASPDAGRPLGARERSKTEGRLGEDFSDVRVTEDSPLAGAFGANAMTYGNAIHLAPGRSLTADLADHELTHVAQQRQFGASAAQFDMSINAPGEDTGLGLFDVSLTTGSRTRGGVTSHGMEAQFGFMPHAEAPYSNRIGLVQTVDMERVNQPGQPDYVWTGDESNREHVKTPEGTNVDMLHGELPAERNSEPWYWTGFPTEDPEDPANDQRFGWNRSPTDRHSAHLYDFPKSSFPLRYTFETVALGRDNQTAYGAVRWGFETDGATGTSNEWFDVTRVFQSGSEEDYRSDVFDDALSEFREFYTHEPIIIYFGYNESMPTDSEFGKMGDVASFMTENPEAQIRLAASADMQGGDGPGNRQLALDRMNAVHTYLLQLGISEDRIIRDEANASASRAQGSSDPAFRDTEGSYQANRRVTLTFENTASMPP
ncbi:eCIS core domain-containing protein [Parerythrobacter aestuarii]|uniref:eCIS core domain-containing protein n=1 Tax=Parerythrobacter aestuarii TaxID=3020909 RepID=UPI0024DEFB16|nr:DUF4157 domain-containing protein [Parerythrobacter aestuarii]